MLSGISSLALVLPPWFADYAQWWVGGFILVFGLLIFGLNDLARLRFGRVWALSSVAFSESLRRKVLWVTPLGIIGVIVVTLLQHPVDQQEAIRQTIKFCLFACGTLVTLTAIILACTSLPREIENRVIFTIVTKPTTRLEVVMGKVLGFIRVSGLIVLIMGVFSFAFLEWENWQLNRQLAERLKTETDPGVLRILQGYQEAGLLKTQSLDRPVSFQVYNHYPKDDGQQWISGAQGYTYVVPFDPTDDQERLLDRAGEDPPQGGVFIVSTMKLKRNIPTKEELSDIAGRRLPMENQVLGPSLPGQNLAAKPRPQISVQVIGANNNILIPQSDIDGGKALTALPQNKNGTYTFAAALTPDQVRQLINAGRFYISVQLETPSVEYEVSPTPTVVDFITLQTPHTEKSIPAAGPPRFVSHIGKYGMQIVGNAEGTGSIADFRFVNAELPAAAKGQVEFRFRGGVIRGGEYDYSKAWSTVRFILYNRKTKLRSPDPAGGKTSAEPPIDFHPETNRDTVVPVDAKYVAGGDFDVYVKGMDNGQWVGMSEGSVQLISAEHSFVLNLAKSLLILWLFSILVVNVAIFSSTFLSWPIAVVLTLSILLGHWGVDQLGDALNNPGRGVAQDLGFGRDAAQSSVVSASVDMLAKMVTVVSTVLPDLAKFPVMDDITRGVSIPPKSILQSIEVLIYYGLPMLVLSFIILKNKEVAP